MKRLVAFIDLAAICITIFFLFALALMSVRSIAVTVWQLTREMYTTHQDWWIAVLIVFSIIWSAIRWRAAYRALDEFKN